MHSRKSTIGLAVLGWMLCLLAGCPERCSSPADTVVEAEDFDQRCETADDCVVVGEGDFCPCGKACQYAAIAREAKPAYNEAAEGAAGQCDTGNVHCEACPVEPPPACSDEGECIIDTSADADGDDAPDASGDSGPM